MGLSFLAGCFVEFVFFLDKKCIPATSGFFSNQEIKMSKMRKDDGTRLGSENVIGIIGGMGPDASARMLVRMIEMARTEFGATTNHEYPEILLHSVPVPEFFSSDENSKKALEILKERVASLSRLPIKNMALACNSAHILLDELRACAQAPIVSMIDEVGVEVCSRKFQKVGLLASRTTISMGIYSKMFEARGVEVVLPNHQDVECLTVLIQEVIAGKIKNKSRVLKRIADDLRNRGAVAIILGCTELPLVFPKDYDLTVVDSVEVLVRKLLIQYYLENNKEEL